MIGTAVRTAGMIAAKIGVRGWISTGRAAKRLGYDPDTILEWCKNGKIDGARRGPGGHWKIPLEWVTNFLGRREPIRR